MNFVQEHFLKNWKSESLKKRKVFWKQKYQNQYQQVKEALTIHLHRKNN